ncbi:major facilitator superfamily domain-containing protein [Phycomyces nitens]|nr:major facilitator superfamily domain-containing protein [Phycomyces nitens]
MSEASGSTSPGLLSGVKKVELYKKVWSRNDQILIFVGLFLLSWAISWESTITATVTPKVTSILGANNLSSILSTILYILQTALLPMISKLSDFTGRAEAYSFAMVFYILAFIIMATANNYPTLVGAKVIYAFGYSGTTILGPILIGDMTSIVNRGIYQSLYNAPVLINLFVASSVGSDFVESGRWRWSFGINCILLGVTSAPLLAGLWNVQFKVKRSGLLVKVEEEERNAGPKMSLWERLVWIVVEIDIIGSLLLIAGLCLVLLPLVLALPKWGGWTSGITLGTLISGIVCWGLFTIWEWKFSPKPIIPLTRWKSRTPLYGVLVVSSITLISSTNWQFLATYLQISRRVDSKTAIYLECGYNVMYIITEVSVGFLMARFKVWRPFIWTGIAIAIVGLGIMIPARLPNSSDAFVVVSQAIVGLGTGMCFIPALVAVQSSVPHNDLAIVTALFQIGGSIAASIGSTMAGAIWNAVLPSKIAQYVPGEYDAAQIISSITYVQGLPIEQYDGAVKAYGEVQKLLNIIAVSLSVLTFVFAVPMQSFGLDQTEESRITSGAKNSDPNEVPSIVSTDDISKSDFKPVVSAV